MDTPSKSGILSSTPPSATGPARSDSKDRILFPYGYPHMCIKRHNIPIYIYIYLYLKIKRTYFDHSISISISIYIYLSISIETLSIYHHFGCPVLPQEMSEPSPTGWPRGLGLSREHESRLALNEWNAQVNKQPHLQFF